MIVLLNAENRTIVSSFFWIEHRNVTDRQTDGQTASRYYSGLHCEQCGRAVKTTLSNTAARSCLYTCKLYVARQITVERFTCKSQQQTSTGKAFSLCNMSVECWAQIACKWFQTTAPRTAKLFIAYIVLSNSWLRRSSWKLRLQSLDMFFSKELLYLVIFCHKEWLHEFYFYVSFILLLKSRRRGSLCLPVGAYFYSRYSRKCPPCVVYTWRSR